MEPLSAMFSIGNSLLQIGQGIKQSNQIRKLERQGPSKYIPEGLKEAESLATSRSNATVAPGYLRVAEKIDQNAANQVSNIARSTTDPSLAVAGIAGVQTNANNATMDAVAMNEQFRDQSVSDLARLKTQIGEFQWRNRQAHNQAVAALRGAKSQNMFNGLSNLFEVGAYFSDDLLNGNKITQ